MTTAGPRQGGTQGNPAHQHMGKIVRESEWTQSHGKRNKFVYLWVFETFLVQIFVTN